MTKRDVLQLQDYYKFLDCIHVHAPKLDDQVTSGPLGYLAMYDEFFNASVRFPFHPFIINVHDLFQIILA